MSCVGTGSSRRLAINGGAPVLSARDTVRWPVLTEQDEAALLTVVRSGQLWRGGTVEAQAKSACGRFERAFAAYQGQTHALAVNNGTVALELALRAVGVGPGDEVIVPAVSFVVTASAALPLGAWPVFVDIDPHTFQIDASRIEEVIGPRTKAICIVHFGGYPSDLDRITAIADRHGLALVEDCAHAHGSQWRGRGLGSFGRFGTFSFQQFKALSCGEGGLLLAAREADWQSAYRFSNLGRRENEGLYDFFEAASNLRLTDLQGAILNSQFAAFPAQVEKRMAGAAYLAKRFAQIGGLVPLPPDPRVTRRGYYYMLFHYHAEAFRGLPRDRFLAALAAEGATGWGRAYGIPIHRNPLFQNMSVPAEHRNAQYANARYPVAERIMAEELVSLHHPILLADSTVLDRIADAVAKVKANVDELL